MSSTFSAVKKLQDKVTPKFLKKASGLDVGRSLNKMANPDLPKIPDLPQTPTIDEAAQSRAVSDRLRRRRGVLANIFTQGTGGGAQRLGG